MIKTQEDILKFIGNRAIMPEKSLLKAGFTRQDITALQRSGYIRRTFDCPTSYQGHWVIYLKPKGTDRLTKLLKE